MTISHGDIGRTGVGHCGSTRERIIDSERDRVGATDIAGRIDKRAGVECRWGNRISVSEVQRSESNPSGIDGDRVGVGLTRVDRARGCIDRTSRCFKITS